MGSSTKWVQFAFKDAFSKENEASPNASLDSLSSSSSSTQHSSIHQRSFKNNFFTSLPTCASYFRQNDLSPMTPTESTNSDSQNTSDSSSKKPQLPSFNNINLLKTNDQAEKTLAFSTQPSNPTSTLKKCLEHLKLLQLQLKQNKEYAQKMFKQQEKKITQAKNKLLDSFICKESLIDDEQMKKLIEKRKQACWSPNQNNFNIRKASSEKLNYEEKQSNHEQNLGNLLIQSKIQANTDIKQSISQESQQKPKLMTPAYFQSFFTSFKTLKMSILQQKEQPIKYDNIFSRGKPRSSKLFHRKPAQLTYKLVKK